MLEGFIKIHRKILDWEWYSDANVARLFFHCLFKVNYTTKKWQGVEIKQGSFITSYEKLASDLNLTIQQIRTALKKLKSTHEITYHSTANYSIISLNNWDDYNPSNTQNNKQITNEQQTNNKRVTTTKKDKKDKKEINNIKDNFLFFYSSYPRKESKGNAEKAYDKALKDGVTTEQLLDGVKLYCKHIKKNCLERQFIKLPATWLNQKCWEDSYTVDLPKSEPKKCEALKVIEEAKKEAEAVTPEDQEEIKKRQEEIREIFKRRNLGKVG